MTTSVVLTIVRQRKEEINQSRITQIKKRQEKKGRAVKKEPLSRQE